jgi:hypothetical protein
MKRNRLAAATLFTVCVIGTVQGSETDVADLFEKPIRLKAGDKFIDAGAVWGHSSPWFADVNGDGKTDLIVGDFSGTFRVFLNTGTNAYPVFKSTGLFQAGGVDAKVPIY